MNVETNSGSANIIHLPISPTPLSFPFPTIDSSDQRRKIKATQMNALRKKQLIYLVAFVSAIFIFLYFRQGSDLYAHLSTKAGDLSFSHGNRSHDHEKHPISRTNSPFKDPAKPLQISPHQKIQRTDLIPADTTVKASVTSVHSSTAEKLMCPKYVVEFVINATDTKDECDGLRKAYDFVCNGSKSQTTDEKPPNTSIHRRLMGVLFVDWKAYYKKHRVQQYESSANLVIGGYHRGLLEDEGSQSDISPENEDFHTPLSPVLPSDDEDEIADEIAAGALSLNADLVDIPQTIMEDETPGISGTTVNQSDHISTVQQVSSVIPPVYETQTCCKSILQVFHELCDSGDDEGYDDKRLFVIVLVIALCGMVKSLIRHFHIRWLPEAGGCILVGVFGGLFMRFFPNMDFGFQHDLFLRLMVPPIGECRAEYQTHSYCYSFL